MTARWREGREWKCSAAFAVAEVADLDKNSGRIFPLSRSAHFCYPTTMFTETDLPPVDPKIVATIKRTVEDHFEGKDLVAVEVDPDEDYLDGQALYTVWVIVNDKADPADLGKRKLGGLISLLRRTLVKEGDDTFPVVRMMTKRDAEQLGRESR